MKNSETKSFVSGVLVILLFVIAFVGISAAMDKSITPTAYADDYYSYSTTAPQTTTAYPTTTTITTSIGFYNGIIKYASYGTHVAILQYDEIPSEMLQSEILEIPSEINGLPVKSINSVFPYNREILSVKIPESVENIASDAFQYFYRLNYIEIPKNVQSINLSSVSTLKKVAIRNPECKINADFNTIPKGVIIYGYPGSTAEEYANTFNREFVDIQYYENTPLNPIPAYTTAPFIYTTAPPRPTTTTTTTTTTTEIFGDIDGSGSVDASDASIILAYYAYTSTGGTADLREFVKTIL